MNVTLYPQATPHLLVIIENDLEKIEKFKQKAWEKQKDTLELDGFRKGHIPRSLAEKKLGYNKLYKQVLETLLFDGIKQAEKPIVSIEEYYLDEFIDGHPIVMHVSVYTKPEVFALDYENIEIEQPELSVKDEEIDAVLQMAADGETKKTEVDREVADSDLIEIDFITKIEDSKINNGDQKGYQLKVGSQTMIPAFEQELIGISKGATKKFTIELPDSYPEGVAGKQAEFEVTVNRIFELEVPEIDDEFAKATGYQSLEDFRKKIEADLISNKQEQANRLLGDKVIQAVTGKAQIAPIPDAMVTEHINHLLQVKLAALNLTKEQLFEKLKTTETEFQRKSARSALNDVRARLVLEEVANREKLAVTEEEVEQYIVAEAEKENKPYKQFASMINRDEVALNIKMKRALELLKAKVAT